jgi:fructose-1,6-bisphosphatase I
MKGANLGASHEPVSEIFDAGRPVVTLEQHILRQQRIHFPDATGEFSFLMSGITLAAKMIQAKVRRAGLNEILGSADSVNVQGEIQQRLDIFSNQVLHHCVGIRDTVGMIASEENEHPIALRPNNPNAKYGVIFDPLDGSSNINVNVSVGTTFSIMRLPERRPVDDPTGGLLQPGSEQVAAGYVLYGPSTILVYSSGQGAHGFTLDPAVGAFILSHENIRIPERGKYYSVNEAYRDSFPNVYQVFIDRLRRGAMGTRYASRYVGSMVADVHRTLLTGGVFMYPPTDQNPEGKLRLMYEANPIAYIVEQAGGLASDGAHRILDVEPKSIHQRTAMIIGGPAEMREFYGCIGLDENGRKRSI